MKNLVRWLEYCNRITYPFINISSELNEAENLRELFIILYVGYVRAALSRGLFYQYVEETEDISHIKGKFDYSKVICIVPKGALAEVIHKLFTAGGSRWSQRSVCHF